MEFSREWFPPMKPENALAHNNLGDAPREQGRADEAIKRFERALAVIPESLMALGTVYRRDSLPLSD